MSQQQDQGNETVAGLAQAVRNTQRRRSSRLATSSNAAGQHGPPEPSSNPRDQQQPLPQSSDPPPAAPGGPDPPAPAPAGPNRWAEAREVKIVVNANTAAANKKSMMAFSEFLLHQHKTTEDPTSMEQGKLKRYIADFITRVRRLAAFCSALCTSTGFACSTVLASSCSALDAACALHGCACSVLTHCMLA